MTFVKDLLVVRIGCQYRPNAECAKRKGPTCDRIEAELKRSSMMELKMFDVEIGTGPEVVKGALVICNYSGFFRDGTKFDSSIDRGRAFQFVIGSRRVIQGWDIAKNNSRKSTAA